MSNARYNIILQIYKLITECDLNKNCDARITCWKYISDNIIGMEHNDDTKKRIRRKLFLISL